MRVMIFAAGRGLRMGAMTAIRPKPLLRVNGEPLIDRLIQQLKIAGFDDLIVNSGHLGCQIISHLGDGRRYGVRIRHSPEPAEAFETGGGLRHALPMLGSEPVAVVNSDVWSDFPFETLRKRSPLAAHLVLIPNPPQHPFGDFGIERGLARNGGAERWTFAGISVLAPGFIQGLERGRYSIIPSLREMTTRDAVTAEVFTGQWFDIGTPNRLAEANARGAQPLSGSE